MSKQISIVGAGIGGVATALALQQRGIAVRIYEQASKLAEVGAGLHMSPNSLHVLYALGLKPALDKVQFQADVIATRHYQTNVANFEAPLDDAFREKFGASYVQFHRADLHNTLIDAVLGNDAESIVLNKQVVGVKEREQDVQLSFLDGSNEHTPVAVAADGVHSVMRSALHGELGAKFTGHVAYRGMVSADTIGTDVIPPCCNIWVGPGKHVVAYYIRRGELLNYVALVEEPGWQTESWTTKGDKAELAAYFENWHPSVQALVEQTPAEQCFKWALLVREPLPRWSTARTTLLGDAAHPMVPYVAQGAAMAIEDAWVLAHFAASGDEPAKALKDYESARLSRTSAVQAAAWEQGQLNHAVDTERDAEQFKGGNFSKADWIYSHNVTTLYP